jgi:hypothetical protein
MSRKKQYIDLLKEAINGSTDGDTTDTVDLKGPFVDGIVSYKGGGELPTHKDASGILERYYFNEDNDDGITIEVDTPPAESNDIDEVPDEDIEKTKEEIEKAVQEQEETPKKATKDLEDAEEEEDVSEATEIENSIIEKLVAEMEEEGDEGAGTKAAGTGDDEKAIPDREDDGEGSGVTEKEVNKLKEQADKEEDEDEDEDEEEEVNKLKEQADKEEDEDEEEEEELDVDKELEGEVEESFKIFSEQIDEDEDEDEDEEEEEEPVEIDSEKIQV